MKLVWLWVGLSLTLGLAGCGDGSQWASRCETSDDCPAEMTCPSSGVFAGHCAIPCLSSTACREELGENAFCHIDGECTVECEESSECMSGFFCTTDRIPDNCRAEP